MALKSDLEELFSLDYWEDREGEADDIIKEIADEAVSYYEASVKKGIDQYGNKWNVPSFDLLKTNIETQFKLAMSTLTPMQFTLIETALITTWASATLKLPATPAPGMSVVNSGVVLVSTPVGTPPLPPKSNDPKILAKRFYDMFTKHGKTISYQYIGIAVAGTPPPPIVVPGAGVTLT
jgi:hypothetical protein